MMPLTSEAQHMGGFEAPSMPQSQIDDKWPVWLRIVTIVGLSGLLWYGIISVILAVI